MDLAAIRAKVKTLIGDSGYDNTALDVIINRQYQRHMPLEFVLEALKTTYTTTTSEGIGTVAIDPDAYLRITGPAYRDGERVSFWTDAERFRAEYPDERPHTITAVDAALETFAFAGDYASKFAAPNTFRVYGSTGNDGMWTAQSVAYASDVTTVTVTGDITDATVDGTIVFQVNNEPGDILYENQSLIWRPFPDDNDGANYILTLQAIAPPAALANTTDEPIEKLWGPVIAISTAMEIFYDYNRKKEGDALIEIRAYFTGLIVNKEVMQFTNTRARGSY